jgi:uncharacterized protein (TIGR02118 family)
MLLRMQNLKVIVLYTAPTDVEEFEKHYSEVHAGLVGALPGIEGVETGRIARALDRGTELYYRIAVLSFADKTAMQNAFGSPEGKALGEDFARIAPEGTRQFLVEMD